MCRRNVGIPGSFTYRLPADPEESHFLLNTALEESLERDRKETAHILLSVS